MADLRIPTVPLFVKDRVLAVEWIKFFTSLGAVAPLAGGGNHQVQVNAAGTLGGISNGTALHVLTSNGAGSAPTFQATQNPFNQSLNTTSSVTFNVVTANDLNAASFPTANPGPGLVWVDTGAANVLKRGT